MSGVFVAFQDRFWPFTGHRIRRGRMFAIGRKAEIDVKGPYFRF